MLVDNKFMNAKILGDLYYHEVYFLYDEPQLFTTTNKAGHRFFTVLSEAEEYHLWYLSAISDASLSLLKCNRIDINSIFTSPELGYVWKLIEYYDNEIELTQLNPIDIPVDDLPTPGFYLNYNAKYA